MNIDLFGHPYVEPMHAKQIPLFHDPAPVVERWATDADARIAQQYDATSTMTIDFKPVRQSLIKDAEREIKASRLPYVSVDDAKKSLFVNARLKSFHFVLYQQEGENWLVYCGKNRAAMDDMRKWEEVFGEGFKAVFAIRRAKGVGFVNTAGEKLELVKR